MKRVIPLIGVLFIVATVSAQAPSGYVTWVDKETGLTTFVPKGYKQIPLPPTESVDTPDLDRLIEEIERSLDQMRARQPSRG